MTLTRNFLPMVLLGLCSAAFAQLTVNRETGEVSIQVPVGAEVNGYSITSANGLLDPENWSSLNDQEREGWNEANPLPTGISELNPFSFTAATESAWELGSPFTGIASPPRDEDLGFKYSLTDGSVVEGEVRYEGPANDFVLRIDPNSGAANFELTSSNIPSVDLVGYAIFSDSGAIDFNGLTGLGETWTNASTEGVVTAELNAAGSQLFEAGSLASIGTIFKPGSAQDVRFEFATADNQVRPGTVVYGEAPVVVTCDPNTMGDIDGNGMVEFADFLVLSNNFSAPATSHLEGDLDCNQVVEFADFLILSQNFNTTVGIAAVPEPSGLLTVGIGALLLLACRRRRTKTIGLASIVTLILGLTASAQAVDFDTRMIVLDADNPGENSQVNNALEAREILRGTANGINVGEDVTSTVDILDFAGDPGDFSVDNPYPNGVNDSSLSDFVVQVTGNLEIPAGDWTIGFNTDDGGLLTLPRVEFVASGNENGATGTPGELIFNGTRGFNWTFGHFTVPQGETLRTEFEGIFFERGGGDGIEVAILDEFATAEDITNFGIELEDGSFEWKVLESGPAPGDFNWDEEVDFADFLLLADNFLTGTTFAQGDNNRDGQVDLVDFTQLVPLLTPPAAAAAVPEPNGLGLLSVGFIAAVCLRRRRK